jgi:uncharacterized protein
MTQFRYVIATLLIGWSSLAFSQEIKLIRPIEVITAAAVLYDSGRYGDVISTLQSIPARDTAYTDMLPLLTNAYIANKEFDKALSICQQQLSASTEERNLFLRLQANATEKKGEYKSAVTLFENAIRQYPTDVGLIFGLALIQYNNAEFEKAAANFFRVLSINPYHSGSHVNLAKLSMRQGSKVHAMLAMGVYLGINEKDNSNLVLVNNFVDNQVTDEGTVPAFGTNGGTRLDQMIRAKFAMEKDFKSVFPMTAPVVRQYELLFDQLGTLSATSDDPFLRYYVPIFTAMKENGGVQPFVYHILTSSSIEPARKWRDKNQKVLKAFYEVTNSALQAKRETLTVEPFGFNTPVSAWYSGNQLVALGRYENEKRLGHWIFMYPNGEKSAEGNYNDAGAKTGNWKYFYKSGKTKSTENYQTGEVTVYSPEGGKKEHFYLKDDKIDGDVELYYLNGRIKEKLRFAAGERDGKREVYYPDGSVKATYQYKNGKIDGDYISRHENGKVYVRTAYKNDMITGKYELFHANGKLAALGEYLNDNPVKLWKYFHSNGKPLRTGNFTDKGFPVGEWTYSDVRGQVVEKRNFDSEGRYDGDITYYQDGLVHYTATYKKDIATRYTYYDENKKVLGTSGGNDGSFKCKHYFFNGPVRSEGANVKGKAQGMWKFYTRYGKVRSEYKYKDDQLDGVAIDYYPSGAKKIVCEYKEGKLHGYYVEYHENGKVKQQGWYQDGNREQQWIVYFPNGTPESDYYYLQNTAVGAAHHFSVDGKKYSESKFNDEGVAGLQYFNSKGETSSVKRTENAVDIVEEYFKTKKLKSHYEISSGVYTSGWARYFPDGTRQYEYKLANGKKQGPYLSYDIDGTLTGTGSYDDDEREGLWKTYHDNGKLYSEGRYLDDERDSVWTYYHDNGQVSSIGAYQNGSRHGSVKYFGPDGAPIMEKLYRQGDLVAFRSLTQTTPTDWTKFTGNEKIVILYANGNKATEEDYKDGLQQSYDRSFYQNGKLYTEFLYKDDQLTGEYKSYYANGKLKEKGSYVDDEIDGTVDTYQEDGPIERSVQYKLGYRHGKAILYKKGVKSKELTFWNGVVED